MVLACRSVVRSSSRDWSVRNIGVWVGDRPSIYPRTLHKPSEKSIYLQYNFHCKTCVKHVYCKVPVALYMHNIDRCTKNITVVYMIQQHNPDLHSSWKICWPLHTILRIHTIIPNYTYTIIHNTKELLTLHSMKYYLTWGRRGIAGM